MCLSSHLMCMAGCGLHVDGVEGVFLEASCPPILDVLLVLWLVSGSCQCAYRGVLYILCKCDLCNVFKLASFTDEEWSFLPVKLCVVKHLKIYTHTRVYVCSSLYIVYVCVCVCVVCVYLSMHKCTHMYLRFRTRPWNLGMKMSLRVTLSMNYLWENIVSLSCSASWKDYLYQGEHLLWSTKFWTYKYS